MQEYYVHGILNESENISMNVFAASEEDAVDKAVELVKQYNEDDIFDVAEVIAVDQSYDIPNTNYGLDGY